MRRAFQAIAEDLTYEKFLQAMEDIRADLTYENFIMVMRWYRDDVRLYIWRTREKPNKTSFNYMFLYVVDYIWWRRLIFYVVSTQFRVIIRKILTVLY